MTADKKFKRLVRERARRTGQSYAAARRALLRKRSEDQVTMVEMTVAAVRVTPAGGPPHLVLEERAGTRQLPIVIGQPEATAIAFALSGTETLRPLTHDFLKQAVDALGGRVLRIEVDHRGESGVFTAGLVLGMADGSERYLDCRVSDAIALAVRCDPPPAVLVPERLLAPPPSAVPAPPRGPFRLRCSCREWVVFMPADVTPTGPREAGHVEGVVRCESCGAEQVVRVPVSD